MSTSHRYMPLYWRRPTPKQLIVFLCILALLCFGAFISFKHIDWHIEIGTAIVDTDNGLSLEYSAAVYWLIIANAISFLSVSLLMDDLHTAETATRNIRFVFLPGAAQTLGVAQTTIDSYCDNPPSYALKPLSRIYKLSILVLVIIAIFGVLLANNWPNIAGWIFTSLIMWTGLVYVGLMTTCDYAARDSFRKLSTLSVLHHNDDTATKRAEDLSRFEIMCEALGDFERMIRYVDYPFLAGSAIIIFHKFFVISIGPYYLGFLAGAIAMHTILANLVSLSIAISTVETKQ